MRGRGYGVEYTSGPGITWTGATPGWSVMPGTAPYVPPWAQGSGQHGAGAQGRAACVRWKQWKQPDDAAATTLRIDTTISLFMRISPSLHYGSQGDGCGSYNSTSRQR